MNVEDIKAIISLNGMCPSTIKWRLTDDCNYDCSYCIRKTMKDREHQQLNNYEVDNALCLLILPQVARIINEMPGWVKLDLIGGECSLLDLHTILKLLFKKCGDKLKRINLTTNMSMSVDYYNDLAQLCYEYGSEIGITCSWHSEYVSLEKFIEKFSMIKSPTNQKGIRIEAVSRLDNQDDIKKLIEICEQNNYTYFIERDFFVDKDQVNTLICQASKKKKDRYKVIDNDDEIHMYKTRNEFITANDHDSVWPTYQPFDYYCSRDYDYVYIDFTKHMGRSINNRCNVREPIKDFHPLKEPMICQRPICTLCGQISISKDIELLKKE